MKKLVVMALALAAAFSARAASMDWSFTASADYKDYTVYLVTELMDFTSVTDVQSKALGTGNNYGTITGSRVIGASGRADGLTQGDKETVNFYYVIVNKDASGYWTMSGSGQAYETSTDAVGSSVPKATATALLATTATAWASGSSSSSSSSSSGGDSGVPEPTGGLLLAVGAGVLALRRKRA